MGRGWGGARRVARAVVFFSWVGPAVRWLAGVPPCSWVARSLIRLERAPGWLLAALVAVTLVLLTVLRELDRLLRAMHPDGGSAYGGQAVVRLFHLPDPSHTETVIRTWEALGGALTRSAGFVFTEYVVVDTFFAAAYTALLGVLLIKLARELGRSVREGEPEAFVRRRRLRRDLPLDDESVAREQAGLESLLGAYLRLAAFAFQALPLLFLVDLTENVLSRALLTAGPAGDSFETLVWVVSALSHLKLALFALILVPAAIAGVSLALLHPPVTGRMRRGLMVLRGQILLLALLAAALFVSDQSTDTLRRWRDEWEDGVWGVSLVLVFAVLTLVLGTRLLRASDVSDDKRNSAPGARTLVLGAVAIAALGGLLYAAWQLGSGLWVVAALVFLAGILSRAAGDVRPPPRDVAEDLVHSPLPGVLAAGAPLLLGLAVITAATPAVAYDETLDRGLESSIVLGLIGVGLVAAAGGLYAAHHRLARWLASSRVFAGLVLVIAAFVAFRVYHNPWRTSELLGSIGVLGAFLLAASFVAYGLAMLAERYEPPSAIAVLRFRRVPFFLLLGVWAVAISLLDRDGIYADARLIDARAVTIEQRRMPPKATDVFRVWADEHARRATPMLMVSAAGGGIRAAYWTAVVLRCVLEGDGDEACRGWGEGADRRASASFFAASGISGGSLGLGAYAAHRRRGAAEDSSWAEEGLDDDAIAPVIAWGLFTDLPMALLRRDGGPDRAEVLERAWERAWLDEPPGDQSLADAFSAKGPETDESRFGLPFLHRWYSGQARFPILFLSGTKVQDGCRVNVSVLTTAVRTRGITQPEVERLVEDCLALRLFERTKGAQSNVDLHVLPAGRSAWSLSTTVDLDDVICRKHDVRLSTAVLLSARFPWALPSGRLKCPEEDEEPINVVDGGYFDTSGASPLVEFTAALTPDLASHGTCIVPVFLQIDTGYADPQQAGDKAPLEAGVPPATVRRARDAREHNARQAAALVFSGQFGRGLLAFRKAGQEQVDRFAHIYPRAHPGARAPLGWSLSETAMAELRRQLSFNSGEIEKVRSWFSGGLSCRPR